MAFQSFEDLKVWERGKDLAVLVYRLLEDCRDFGLRDQMQRAAVSIPSNVAEGYERSPREFCRFLSIAVGSSSELQTQAYIAAEVGHLSPEQSEQIIDEAKQFNRMMRSLSRAQLRKFETKETPTDYVVPKP